MNTSIENKEWSLLTYEEKNRILFFRQSRTLELLIKRGAISSDEYNKSLYYLKENENNLI